MKKFISILLFACLTLAGFSQTSGNYSGYLHTAQTLANATTFSDTVSITGPKHNITFQCTSIKNSGTVAGSIKIYGSTDGTTYGSAARDSVTLADGSAVYQFAMDRNRYTSYRILITTSGTQNSTHRVHLMYRKE